MSSTELHTGTLTPVKTINSHQEFMDFVHEHKLTAWLNSNIEEYFEKHSVNDIYIKAGDKYNAYYAIRLRDGYCNANMDIQKRVPKIKTKIVLDND